MNEFVDECRSEWKRLGVPDSIANEMATDLAADLAEAEAEGASAEEVLGSGAFDPRSFATAWAAERGLIQRPPPNGHELPSRSRMAAAIGAFALVASIGAVLVILAPGRLTLVSSGSAPRPGDPGDAMALSPDGRTLAVAATVDGRLWIPPDGSARVVTLRLPAPAARIAAVDATDSGVDTHAVGSVLLTVGLAGVVALTMFWLWFGPGRWSRRRRHIDDRPSGPAY